MDVQPLTGVRVVELAGWNGAFTGRLLADAGAEVVRVVPPGGDALDREPPFFADSAVSIQSAWYNLGKRIVVLDTATADGKAALTELLAAADLLIEDWQPGEEPLSAEAIAATGRALTRVSLTPFGSTGPWAGYRSADIVANALCGSASVTGIPETGPLNGYGNQTVHTAGLYGAICALAGLRAARITGQAQHIDLSAHEALIACTEQMLMQWFFPTQGNWTTPIAARQGPLHWSGLYSVFPDRNGNGLMVTAAQWLTDVIVPWMDETGGAQDLSDSEKYPNIIALVRDGPHVMEVLRQWVAGRDADETFFEAQKKRLSWGAVWSLEKSLESPQIAARGYLAEREVPGNQSIPFPGRIFNTDGAEPPLELPRRIEVSEVGWEPRPVEREAGTAAATRPLEGIRILDFTHVLAGPFGTRALGDLGAEVIKVGTASRGAAANSPAHPYFAMWNRSKRNILINMKSDEGKAVARKLAASCDVIIENFSAGVLSRWGLDKPALEEANPGLTVISMAGMGHAGPWKDMVTYAPTLHALTGLTDLTGTPDNHLIGYGFSLCDHLSGLTAVVAALEGIEHRRRTGRGLAIDLAQYQVGLHLMAPGIIDYYANGRNNPEPVGNRDPFGGRAPQGIYPCDGEDRWVAIAIRGDEEFRTLTGVMGLPDLAEGRFATHEGRIEAHADLDEAIANWTRAMDAYDVMERLQRAGLAAGVVQNAADLDERDPQLAARGFFTTAHSDAIGEYRLERFPARFNGEPIADYLGVRDNGADTFDVMTGVVGLTDDEVAELVAGGALT